uniref:Uncharacterized protein n=1 Tax=Marseillevirus LCMAC101 TaxID=2506602 RepID=A0A481YRL9_9VIRU|nr:MAG: uncharacterized protein LCMAC101_02740 [Marseillevirus LCMAC101]
MEPKEKSHFVSRYRADISLKGEPVYALTYNLPKKREQKSWDITSFRPDPRNFLKKGTFYKGTVTFSRENLFDGTEILIPREIRIGKNKKFNNIR